MVQLLEGYDIAVPRDDHYHHPLAAIYRVSVIEHIEHLFAMEQLRPRFLFSKVNTREVSTDFLREIDPSLATLKNLNRPEEYFDALKLAGLDIDPAIEKLLVSPDREQS
jgi:molybdopterin-guanine dinucleotide biosynthesis protein A